MRWRRQSLAAETLGAGAAFTGRLWCGDGTEHDPGRVVVDSDGVVIAAGSASTIDVPFGCLEIDGDWVGPGVVDAHVHLAFGSAADLLHRGVVAVRDLGAPPLQAMRWRQEPAPRVEIAGPLLTAPGGYPSRSWGSAGFAAFVDDAEQATRLVSGLVSQVDVVKLALEPDGGPVPDTSTCAAVVAAAHAGGRRVACHALTVEMVQRALDAGIDELAHTPVEPLPTKVVDRIASAGVRVVSTLHTFVATGSGDGALANARALATAGVDLRYGTDLGNTGVPVGVDETELGLLAVDVGLGADAALRAATEPVSVGQPAALVVLDADPRERPRTWRTPRAVMVGPTLLLRS